MIFLRVKTNQEGLTDYHRYIHIYKDMKSHITVVVFTDASG